MHMWRKAHSFTRRMSCVITVISPEPGRRLFLTNRRASTSSSPPPPVIFIAGCPKAALLLWFFGDFRCGAVLFVVIHVIYKYKNR